MHENKSGWWEKKGIKWGQVKWLDTNGVYMSNERP